MSSADLRHVETDALLATRAALAAQIVNIDRELEARGLRPIAKALGRPRSSTASTILTRLANGPATAQELAAATGQSAHAAAAMCSAMTLRGELRRVDLGLYALPSA